MTFCFRPLEEKTTKVRKKSLEFWPERGFRWWRQKPEFLNHKDKGKFKGKLPNLDIQVSKIAAF